MLNRHQLVINESKSADAFKGPSIASIVDGLIEKGARFALLLSQYVEVIGRGA
jgi:hypothetical protein